MPLLTIKSCRHWRYCHKQTNPHFYWPGLPLSEDTVCFDSLTLTIQLVRVVLPLDFNTYIPQRNTLTSSSSRSCIFIMQQIYMKQWIVCHWGTRTLYEIFEGLGCTMVGVVWCSTWMRLSNCAFCWLGSETATNISKPQRWLELIESISITPISSINLLLLAQSTQSAQSPRFMIM